ncbi:MAG: tetraacyldisaccharide 4'-kinase [Chromatiales bacterium]|jgi:tetraacyldisaccharide 4'-kinase
MKSPGYFWKKWHPVALLLFPLSLLMRLVVFLRRLAYKVRLLPVYRSRVPVIVIGNLTVGGTGKTPLVIWMCNHLATLGYRPGVVLRGYGGKAATWPQQVRADSDPQVVGDEAVVIAQQTGCPVCASPSRADAAHALLEHDDCDVIISDDGLQHYALGRDIEIVVIDGDRRFGNGMLLPAGPLRESPRRLRRVDFVIVNGHCSDTEQCLRLEPGPLVNLVTGETRPLANFRGESVHLVTGLGNPQRFIDMLRDAGLDADQQLFPDHHDYRPDDFAFGDELPVIMTAKDAVKIRPFADHHYWYLRLEVKPPVDVIDQILNRLRTRQNNGQKTA